jgi:hypothetical protein
MRRVLPALAALLALPLPGLADGGPPASERCSPLAAQAGDCPIVITINPEGRVSAQLVGAFPPPAAYGAPVELAVAVVNQGFSTGRLEARLVGSPAAAATLDFHPEALKGIPLERRSLRITLTGGAPTDLTIAFRLRNGSPDLGGRDRIHVLMRGE